KPLSSSVRRGSRIVPRSCTSRTVPPAWLTPSLRVRSLRMGRSCSSPPPPSRLLRRLNWIVSLRGVWLFWVVRVRCRMWWRGNSPQSQHRDTRTRIGGSDEARTMVGHPRCPRARRGHPWNGAVPRGLRGAVISDPWGVADMVTTEPNCPACGHAISRHYGRWCRVPTDAVNRAGRQLICCCEAVDADERQSADH